METYTVSNEMNAEADRMVITLAVGGNIQMFDTFANRLADTYSADGSEEARNKVKEYLRRKVLATDINPTLGGGIQIGNVS